MVEKESKAFQLFGEMLGRIWALPEAANFLGAGDGS